MIISDSAFWFLAFSLYVIDNIKLIDVQEMLLVESMAFKMEPRLAQIPFEIRGRCLTILNPFFPFLMTFKAAWSPDERDKDIRAVRRDRRLILRLQRRVLQLRVIAALGFLNLFVAGPILASGMGLASSLLHIGTVHLSLLLLLVFVVARDFFDLPSRYWTLFILECVICPMYLPTLLKRLSWQITLESNGVSFARRYGSTDLFSDLQSAVAVRTTEALLGDETAHDTEQLEKCLSRDNPE
jgi:hypothetical protein